MIRQYKINGGEVRRLIRGVGLGQNEFIGMLGISPRWFYNQLSGRVRPDYSLVIAIADYFNIPDRALVVPVVAGDRMLPIRFAADRSGGHRSTVGEVQAGIAGQGAGEVGQVGEVAS